MFKAHRRLYHSALGFSVIKRKKKELRLVAEANGGKPHVPRGDPDYRDTSLITNRPPPLAPPKEPTVGSYGVANSYKRGSPVLLQSMVAPHAVFTWNNTALAS